MSEEDHGSASLDVPKVDTGLSSSTHDSANSSESSGAALSSSTQPSDATLTAMADRRAEDAKKFDQAHSLTPQIKRGLNVVPRFDDLLLKTIAESYDIYPVFDRIPQEYLDSIINLLDPSKVDFAVAAKYIVTEKFWRRLSQERWVICQIKQHGNSWKRMFVERHLSGLFETYYPSVEQQNHEKLMIDVDAGKPFCYFLKIHQLLSHLDIGKVLSDFPHLASLEVKYGARKLGMDYDKALFGMQLADAMSLARLVSRSQTLTKLSLPENLLNDETIYLLMKGISDNCTLASVDLSRNRIGDIGAKRVASMLKRHQVLTELNLNDNMIHEEGAREIAGALQKNDQLITLNMGLNPIGDNGGAAILNALINNKFMKAINLSSCDLKSSSAKALAALLNVNDCITQLQVANNDLAVMGGKNLSDALTRANNSQLIELDLRNNPSIAPNVTAALQQVTTKKLAQHKQSQRKAFQMDWDVCM